MIPQTAQFALTRGLTDVELWKERKGIDIANLNLLVETMRKVLRRRRDSILRCLPS